MPTTRNDINTNSEAYNTGYEAAKLLEPRSANPYCRGTVERINWDAGWMAVAPHGWLLRYSDATYIRPATSRELRDSICAGAEGIIGVTSDGERVACYVER